jgi:hypothetical protein
MSADRYRGLQLQIEGQAESIRELEADIAAKVEEILVAKLQESVAQHMQALQEQQLQQQKHMNDLKKQHAAATAAAKARVMDALSLALDACKTQRKTLTNYHIDAVCRLRSADDRGRQRRLVHEGDDGERGCGCGPRQRCRWYKQRRCGRVRQCMRPCGRWSHCCLCSSFQKEHGGIFDQHASGGIGCSVCRRCAQMRRLCRCQTVGDSSYRGC